MADADYSDFLSRTGASDGKPDYAAFLARTGAVEAVPKTPQPTDSNYIYAPGDYPSAEPSTFNQTAREPQAPASLSAMPKTAADLRAMLAETPGWTSGGVLPIRVKNDASGNADPSLGVRPDLGPLRGIGTGLLDLIEGPNTGTITPEARNLLVLGAMGGRLAPSVARGTEAAIRDTAELGAPVNRLYDPRPPMTPPPVADAVAAPLSPEFRANPGVTAPTGQPGETAPNRMLLGAPGAENRLAAPPPTPPAPAGAPVPQSAGAAASREGTAAPLPEPTPAQKATALQKMVNQSAEDRLTPQGRDDNTYFPGVVRPEAMRDFTPAADGKMSSALEHKTLYNTDSNYHDQYDAQVKKNNNVMVDGLHDMFGDANAREAAMQDARELMPGSVNLFKEQKSVDTQPIADKIKEIMAGPAGKIDGVANIMRKMGPKLLDANGKAETLPSQIKGMFDDINNKLYDKSPTTEGNEARQASSQLKDLKTVVSDVIGKGLPGTKWTDYLSNLSGALGQVNKLDYMQQFLTGTKKLTNGAGELQLSKVDRMLEDIRKHSADQTGGARQMTMEEINKIEAARNELALKDLLDRRAAVRGSPTVQLGNASGVLGSGPLGAGIKGAAEAALHVGLAATTGGVGNAALGGYRYIVKPAVQAAKAQKAANALAATKNRLLDTTPNRLANPD